MIITKQDLEKIADLACLHTDHAQEQQLIQDITAIMNFVDTLRSQDTNEVAPLFHPLDIHQPPRSDEVTVASCLDELEAIAPLFEDNLYLVPQVLETEN